MSGLARDNRGAIMVMALFMAIIAAAFLYYVVGLGEAILIRERTQDGADATAFSAAVVHARGMNLIAMVNIMMAAALAVLVLLKLISAALRAAMGILAAIAIIYPAAPAHIAQLKKLDDGVRKVERKVRPRIKESLKQLHELSRVAIRPVVPLAAEAKAMAMADSDYGPPLGVGGIFPINSALPTSDGQFDKLCEKSGEFAGEFVTVPLRALVGGGLGKWVGKVVSRFTGGLARRFAGYFCGGGGSAPVETYDVDTAYPPLSTPEWQRCSAPGGGSEADCRQAERQLEEVLAAYDVAEGKCAGTDARATRMCEERRRQARLDCHPKSGVGSGDGRLVDWRWREQKVTNTYELVDGPGGSKRVQLRSVERDPIDARIVDGSRQHDENPLLPPRPCESEQVGLQYVVTRQMWTNWDKNPDRPLCHEKYVEPTPEFFRNEVSYREVSDVLHCILRTEETIDFGDEQLPDEMRDYVPQQMCSCAEQGEEGFQLRSIFLTDTEGLLEQSDEPITLATLGRDPGQPKGSVARLAAGLGHLVTAQAEFYFDGDEGRDEWLWHMSWKARMRRFRVVQDTGWQCRSSEDTCPEPHISLANICARIDSAVSTGPGRCGSLLSLVDEVSYH